MNQVMGLVCFTGPLVLQAPPAVFEGEPVTLRCHTEQSIAQNTLTFYKNDTWISSGQRSELLTHHANRRDNGVYHCSGKKGWHLLSTSSNSISIQVQGTTLIILNGLVRGSLSTVVEVE